MTETPAASNAPPVLRQQIATARRDILQPIFGGLMRPTDDVLVQKGGGKGLKIYEEIERDPVAFAVLQKRKLAVIARDWEVEAGGTKREDRKAAELVERVIAGEWDLSFDKICLDLLDATLKGYAVAEIVWDVRDGFIIPVEVLPKNQRRFVFDDEAKLRLLTWSDMVEGEELPDRKFLVHRFGDKDGDPYGRGLGHQLFWWVYFKRMAVQFWLVFAEKFGSPTVKGEYDPLMSEEDQDKFLTTLSGVAQNSAMIFPKGAIVELMEALRSGTVTYPELVEYCDRMITLAVLGNTLTTSEGSSGSRALGQVHAGVEETIVDADADMLSGTLNSQLLRWIAWLNYPNAKPPKVWRPRPTEEEAEAKLQQEQIRAFDMAIEHVNSRRRLGWEPADATLSVMDQIGGDWVYTGKVTAVGAPDPAAEPEEPDQAPPELANPDKPRNAIDDLVDQVDHLAAPAFDAVINQVRGIIDEVEAAGGELADVLPRLMDVYPTIDIAELASVMAGALTVADLTGRVEVADADRG